MKLSEMRAVLAERGIQLTKSLGQNFLHDAQQLGRIVTAAELKPTDKVLESGPGLGPMTELLLAQAGHVLAIEKDARLVAVLRERFGSSLALTPALSPGERGNEAQVNLMPASNSEQHAKQRLPLLGERAGVREDVEPKSEIRSPKWELLHADALDFLRREARDWRDRKSVV